jgi:UTP:GlnB (protein PII) uridylyltransferase
MKSRNIGIIIALALIITSISIASAEIVVAPDSYYDDDIALSENEGQADQNRRIEKSVNHDLKELEKISDFSDIDKVNKKKSKKNRRKI